MSVSPRPTPTSNKFTVLGEDLITETEFAEIEAAMDEEARADELHQAQAIYEAQHAMFGGSGRSVPCADSCCARAAPKRVHFQGHP